MNLKGLKVVFTTITNYIRSVKYISLLKSFGSLLVTSLMTLLLWQKAFINNFLEVSVLSVSNHWELSSV